MLYHNIFDKDIQANSNTKFGIVVAEFNKQYTEKMLEDAQRYFKEKGARLEKIIWVPGSYELPFGAQKLLDEGMDAVLTLGVVIRGDTTHYNHVCDAVTQGVMRVSLDNKKPVIFGLLTCENEQQVKERMPRTEDLVIATIQMANIANNK